MRYFLKSHNEIVHCGLWSSDLTSNAFGKYFQRRPSALPPNSSPCLCESMCTSGGGVYSPPCNTWPGLGICFEQQKAVQVDLDFWALAGSCLATFASPLGTQLLCKEAWARQLKNVDRERGTQTAPTCSSHNLRSTRHMSEGILDFLAEILAEHSHRLIPANTTRSGRNFHLCPDKVQNWEK